MSQEPLLGRRGEGESHAEGWGGGGQDQDFSLPIPRPSSSLWEPARGGRCGSQDHHGVDGPYDYRVAMRYQHPTHDHRKVAVRILDKKTNVVPMVVMGGGHT